MSEMKPIRHGGSLLERAAQAYDFGKAFQPRADMFEPLPIAAEAPVEPAPGAAAHPVPESPPEPVVEPVVVPVVVPVAEQVVEPVIEPAAGPAPVQGPRIEVITAEPMPLDGVLAIDRDNLAARGMLVPGAPVSALAEEFRLIKRQLLNTARAMEAEAGDRARMILVGSANPGDGKTYCAINLALSLAAERDAEVLLVDADFAKPDVLHRLGLEDRPGLLDALARSDARIEDYVLPTDVPQLSLLPSGTRSTHDTELIASDRTRVLLAELMAANPRRIIVFDSPPVLAASPAATLAHHVGQVMLVVRADRTPESDLRSAVALLDGCEQIQLVLNAVSFVPGGQRLGSYYGYGKESAS